MNASILIASLFEMAKNAGQAEERKRTNETRPSKFEVPCRLLDERMTGHRVFLAIQFVRLWYIANSNITFPCFGFYCTVCLYSYRFFFFVSRLYNRDRFRLAVSIDCLVTAKKRSHQLRMSFQLCCGKSHKNKCERGETTNLESCATRDLSE